MGKYLTLLVGYLIIAWKTHVEGSGVNRAGWKHTRCLKVNHHFEVERCSRGRQHQQYMHAASSTDEDDDSSCDTVKCCVCAHVLGKL